jgi:ankyrin repeat protein
MQLQVITGMAEYSSKSQEELRLEYLNSGQKQDTLNNTELVSPQSADASTADGAAEQLAASTTVTQVTLGVDACTDSNVIEHNGDGSDEKEANANDKACDQVDSSLVDGLEDSEEKAVLSTIVTSKQDINARLSHGRTILEQCVLKDNADTLRVVLKYGANIETRGASRNMTSLMYASKRNHHMSLSLLLNKKPSRDYVNAVDEDNWSALMMAAANGGLEAAKLLIAADADVNIEDAAGDTALLLAIKHSHYQVANELLLHPSIHSLDHCDEAGETSLTLAATANCAAVIRLLLERGANPHLSNRRGYNALSIAASKGYLAPVNLLLHARVDPMTVVNEVSERCCAVCIQPRQTHLLHVTVLIIDSNALFTLF